MARESVTLQPAYVLHQRAFRDTSRIVDCLCPDYGRVALVARGVQRPKSSLRSVLMPFQPITVSWVRRGEMGTLTSAEPVGPPSSLPAEALMSGWYLNELLLRLVQSHDPQHDVFALYGAALGRLADTDRVPATLRWFEKRLLDELGYGLSLRFEADGSTPVAPDGRYLYRTGRGPQRAGDLERDDDVVDGDVLLAMAADDFSDARVVRQARIVLYGTLSEQLGDRPLRVRDVARDMQRSSKSTGSGPAPGTKGEQA